MKNLLLLMTLIFSSHIQAAGNLPARFVELLPYVQPAPDQGETNTCWFVASTGAMELLLNKIDQITGPEVGGRNDLSESFIMWQRDYRDRESRIQHFVQEIVMRFNHGQAVHQAHWPFDAFKQDGSPNMSVWNIHPEFAQLPRMSVPQVKTRLLFARGKKWATYVLRQQDIEAIKQALVETGSPVIVNYNDDGFWHVVLIVGYDDTKKGTCYELEADECNEQGAFYVRDSNGQRYDARAYNWFLYKGNAAAVVELKEKEFIFANQ